MLPGRFKKLVLPMSLWLESRASTLLVALPFFAAVAIRPPIWGSLPSVDLITNPPLANGGFFHFSPLFSCSCPKHTCRIGVDPRAIPLLTDPCSFLARRFCEFLSALYLKPHSTIFVLGRPHLFPPSLFFFFSIILVPSKVLTSLAAIFLRRALHHAFWWLSPRFPLLVSKGLRPIRSVNCCPVVPVFTSHAFLPPFFSLPCPWHLVQPGLFSYTWTYLPLFFLLEE